jgi:phage portal protein BeeE
MGIITSLVAGSSDVIVKEPTTAPRNRPDGGAAIVNTWNGRVPIPGAAYYRHWAKYSEWVRGAINIRRSQISSAEWDIVPFDQRRPYSKRLRNELRDRFLTPNPSNDSYRTFIEPIVEDLITLDAGAIEKVRTPSDDLVELWPVNGAEIRVSAIWDGDPDEYRYFWYPDNQLSARWKNDDFIYMMANRRTDSVIGLSPLETLKLTIEAELGAHEYNRRQVEGAAPDGLLHLGEGVPREDVEAFRAFFESEVAGRGTLAIYGGGKQPAWLPFRSTNRDMQFLEWQIYLVRKIAVVLGLTPQDLGVTFDINRSTAETQIQISEDRGLRPMMSLLQEYLTEEVVWDRSFGGQANNLAFRFTALNLKESTAKANINQTALAGVPWRYVNEARVAEGREPIPELEGKLIMATSIGAVDLSDVPTVREVLEMQTKRNQPAPPSGSSDSTKSHPLLVEGPSVNVAAPDLSPLERIVSAISPVSRETKEPVLNLMTGPVTRVIAPTPVNRSVEFVRNGDQISSKLETVIYDDSSTKVFRTDYVIDDEGMIVGKTETEVSDADQRS